MRQIRDRKIRLLECLARQGKMEVLEGLGAARGENLKGNGLKVRHKVEMHKEKGFLAHLALKTDL